MTVHQVAKEYAQSPSTVREWPWEDVVRAQVMVRAEAGARETVQKHQEARRAMH